jgi:branched-subunit amino acid transport protein
MSDVWVTILSLAVVTALIRGAGPLLLGGRELPGAVQAVIALLAPALLAALVVIETFADPAGGELNVDARVVGVGGAACVLGAGGTTLPAVIVAAALTAATRALF